MNIGRLRHTITLQSSTVASRQASGEPVLTWATYAAVAAQVSVEASGETSEGNRNTGQETISVLIRYSSAVSGVSHTNQLIWDSKTYRIEGVKTDEKKTSITITAIRRN